MEIKHLIRTLEDIRNVITIENVDCFLKDFETWLRLSLITKDIERDTVKEVEPTVFKWIDDGKNDIKVNITIKSD